MCISLQARFFLRTHLVEQVWLGVDDQGNVQTVEIYDVFFETPEAAESNNFLKEVVLLAVSPHDLTTAAGDLKVTAEQYPGERTNCLNSVYIQGFNYELESREFTVGLRASKEQFQPEIKNISGTVVLPDIKLPEQILSAPDAQELLRNVGTVFELHFGEQLAPKTKYAMRLIVRPQRLNLEFEVREVPGNGVEAPRYREQPLNVPSPVTLFSDTVRLLEHLCKSDHAHPPDILPILDVLRGPADGQSPQNWKTALPEEHRLFVIYSNQCELTEPQVLEVSGTSGSIGFS